MSTSSLRSARNTPGKSKPTATVPRRGSVGHVGDTSSSFEARSSSESETLLANRRNRVSRSPARGRGALARGRGGRGRGRGRGRGGRGGINANFASVSRSSSNSESDQENDEMLVDEGLEQPVNVVNGPNNNDQILVGANPEENAAPNLQIVPGNVQPNINLIRNNNNAPNIVDFVLNNLDHAARINPVLAPGSPTVNNTNQPVNASAQAPIQSFIPTTTAVAVDSNPFRGSQGPVLSASESYQNYSAASKGLPEFNDSIKSTNAWLIKFDSVCRKLTEEQKHTLFEEKLEPNYFLVEFNNRFANGGTLEQKKQWLSVRFTNGDDDNSARASLKKLKYQGQLIPFVREFQNAVTRYRNRPTDSDLNYKMTKKLPKEMRAVLYDKTTELSFDAFSSYLIKNETTFNHLLNSQVNGLAKDVLAMVDNRDEEAYLARIRCYNCNKYGHFARDCPDNHAPAFFNRRRESNDQRRRDTDNWRGSGNRAGRRGGRGGRNDRGGPQGGYRGPTGHRRDHDGQGGRRNDRYGRGNDQDSQYE